MCTISSGIIEGASGVQDCETAERSQSLEHRPNYAARFEKLLRRPQAPDIPDTLRLYD
jgi:hypothetical protein